MATATHAALPASLRAGLGARLRTALSFDLADATELDPGVIHNNRLFRLSARDGRDALLKLYQQDGRRRLEREYAVLSFLHAHGFTTVPAPYLCDDTHYFAVYSLEPGANKPAAEWTEANAAAAAHFAVDLHRITPATPGADFPPAYSGTFSYADQLAGIRRRLALFTNYAQSTDSLPEPIRSLVAVRDPVAEVEHLINAALRDLSPHEIEARVPHEHHRLSTGDFAPHNILIRPPGHPDGHLCVVDYEYSGWDEPAALVASFLTAEQALGLSPNAQRTFLETYSAAEVAPPGTFARLDRVSTLFHLGWSAVHLQLLTPEFIAKKRFASPNLDVDAHLADQIAKLHRRLALAREVISVAG